MKNLSLQAVFLIAILCSGLKGFSADSGWWGEWSEWSEWTTCTRTCGAGVSYQNRTCNNGTCSGAARQYRSCCVQPCPVETPDFRAEQCSNYNNRSIFGGPTNWKPTEEGKNDCQLSCLNENNDRLVTSIASGTPCRTFTGQRGVCLETLCTVVGCDGILGSLKVEDQCLRCLEPGEADGQCVGFSGTFTPNTQVTGQVAVLTIPVEATSIRIVHPLKPLEGSLVLRTSSGTYNFNARGGSSHAVGGVAFTYARGTSEEVVARGPLSTNITIELHGVNFTIPEVQYRYYILQRGNTTGESECNLTAHDPSDHTGDKDHVFAWVYDSFSECSVNCSTGMQTSYAQCRDVEYNRVLPSDFCICGTQGGLPRPLPIQRECHRPACPPRWVVGEWSSCSVSCGSGVQTRNVECRPLPETGREMAVSESLCPNNTRPAGTRPCSNEQPCATWREGEWGECSASCGGGLQERRVVCVNSSIGKELPSTSCSHLTDPPSSQTCNSGPCPPLCHWHPSRWKKCSNSCGIGVQRMHYRCRYNATDKFANKSCCAALPVPEQVQECVGVLKCTELKWVVTPWEECEGKCGINAGQQRQESHCGCMCRGHAVSLPDDVCSHIARPPNTSVCTRTRNCSVWNITDWSPCTTTCGEGTRMRNVTCTKDGQPSTGCSEPKPDHIVVCKDNPPCPTTTSTTCPDKFDVECSLIFIMHLCADDYWRDVCCKTCTHSS